MLEVVVHHLGPEGPLVEGQGGLAVADNAGLVLLAGRESPVGLALAAGAAGGTGFGLIAFCGATPSITFSRTFFVALRVSITTRRLGEASAFRRSRSTTIPSTTLTRGLM